MGAEVSGDRLFYIKDEELAEIIISPYGLIYWEYQGVFKDEGVQDEDCWDIFYKLENCAVTQIHQGTYSTGANEDRQADTSGERGYRYCWDRQEVSSDSYYERCKEVGWIRGDLVITEDVIPSADDSLKCVSKIIEGTLNIRSIPQHDSELVGTVEERNERLAYYGEIGMGLSSDGLMHEWYRITTEDGVTGWVRSDLVEEQRG